MKPNGEISMIRTNFAVGLVSAAIIAFQLVLMQILSYVQWYHFAYMIISVALLGFGAAGTFLTIFRKRLVDGYRIFFPFFSILTSILMPLSILVANSGPVRFDSLLIFQDFHYAGRLLATYLVFFLPFFTGALCIGLSFVKFAGQIGKIYFSNLVGSGIGGIIALVLMHFAMPERQPAIIAALAFAGGLMSLPREAVRLLKLSTVFSAIVLVSGLIFPPKLIPSEYKDIKKTLLLPEAKIEYKKSSPYGLVEVVSSPVLRFAPGLSLSYNGLFPVRKAVFSNGNWAGFVVPKSVRNGKNILEFTPRVLPYYIVKIDNVLIIDAGTGENVSLAFSHKASHIVANEADPEIFRILKSSFADTGVELHQTMARTMLAKDDLKYGLIVVPQVGTFFGNSGLNAVEPRYELSIEALQEMWKKLSENGIISLSCWMDYPVRNAYRLLSTAELLLDRNIAGDHRSHIIAVRSWNAVIFLVGKSGFGMNQIKIVKKFCDDMMFDPLILPGSRDISSGTYNTLQDTSFFSNLSLLLSPGRDLFIKGYKYRVQPTTDDRPFFFQNIKPDKIIEIAGYFKNRSAAFLELGYLLVILTFIQIILIAGILIILPLFAKGWKSRDKTWTIIYFSGIGLAYMFLEIVFIQQFTFYFGQAIYATAATIAILLFTSGLGSYYSGKFQNAVSRISILPVFIALVLILYAFFLSPLLNTTIALSYTLKIVLSIILLGVPGFILGMPFPSGIEHLSKGNQDDIPWAWALNGYFSVISTALATIISVESGYRCLLLISAFTYALAGISSIIHKARCS